MASRSIKSFKIWWLPRVSRKAQSFLAECWGGRWCCFCRHLTLTKTNLRKLHRKPSWARLGARLTGLTRVSSLALDLNTAGDTEGYGMIADPDWVGNRIGGYVLRALGEKKQRETTGELYE